MRPAIMRALLDTNKEILQKLEDLERKEIEQDEKIVLIFECTYQCFYRNLYAELKSRTPRHIMVHLSSTILLCSLSERIARLAEAYISHKKI